MRLRRSDFFELQLMFFPPDKRKRDLDNMLARMKSGLDGFFDALEIDDARVRAYSWLGWGEVLLGGSVSVVLRSLRVLPFPDPFV